MEQLLNIEARMYDWEMELCELMDKLYNEPEEMMRWNLQEEIIDNVEDLLKMAYTRGRENGYKLGVHDAQADKQIESSSRPSSGIDE